MRCWSKRRPLISTLAPSAAVTGRGGAHETLPADVEDVLDRDDRWILGVADERGIIDGEESGRPVPAQPVRLTRRCACRHDPRALADDRLIGAQIDGLAVRAVAARKPRRGPAHGHA